MTNEEIVVIEIDDSEVKGAVDRSNKGLQTVERSSKSAGDTAKRSFRDASDGLTGFERLLARAATRVTEFGAAVGSFRAIAAAVAFGTRELVEHSATLDGLTNTYRVLRLALSPTLFTGGTLAIGIAVEETIKLVLAREKLLQQDALFAVRNKQNFTDTEAIGIAGVIQGEGRGNFQSLFKGKSAADVIELINQFKQLRDPVEKAQFAVKNFGDNADKAIPLLTERLRDNIAAAYDMSTAFDGRTRQSLDDIAKAFHRPAEAAGELLDSYRRLKEQAKERIVITVAEIHETMLDRPNARALAFGGRLLTKESAELADRAAPPEERIPSTAEFVAMSHRDSTAALQRLREAAAERGAQGPAVGQGLRDRSDAAVDRYGNSATGLSHELSMAEDKLYALEKQLKDGAGTSLESTTRARILQTERQVEALKPRVEEARRSETLAREINKRREQGETFLVVGNSIISGDEIQKANPQFNRVPSLLGRVPDLTSAASIVAAQEASNAAEKPLPSGLQSVYGPYTGQVRDWTNFMRGGGLQQQFISAETDRNVQVSGETPEGLTARLKGTHDRDEENARRTQQLAVSDVSSGSNFRAQMAELAGGRDHEVETAEKVAGIREAALQKELALTGDIVKYTESSLQNEYSMRLKIAEVQKRQFDSIKEEASSLFETLVTKPSAFLAQLGRTLLSNIIKPVADGFGSLVAGVTQPIIFGKDGKGGIAGALGGVFGKSNGGINDVHLVNGSVPVVITNLPTGGGSGSSPYSSSASTFARLAGGGLFAGVAAARTVGGEVIGGGDSTAGLERLSSGLYRRGPDAGLSAAANAVGGPGGTSGFAGRVASIAGGGSSSSARGGSNIDGLLAGGLIAGGGSLLSSGVQNKSALSTILGGGLLGGGIGLAGGPIGAVGGLGIGLGINGFQRGGLLGTAELTVGGAALGFNIGGPLGAAIGAGAGLLVGIGKQLFGGDDDATHASKLVKQIYGVDIPKNSGAIKQILALAKSEFGGAISMAVYSPQVRQLIQMYSESTGQKSSLFLQNPVAGSLVETGGTLYQQASYNNGTPYAFDSSLPTLGPSTNIPTGNPYAATPGGLSLSLSIGGNDAARFMTGQVVTPQFVGSQSVSALQSTSSRLATASSILAPSVIAG